MPVMTAATWWGVPGATGATPTDTRDFASTRFWPTSTGRCASAQRKGSKWATLADITAPSTDVPSTPPTCIAVVVIPPATPASSTGGAPAEAAGAPPPNRAQPTPHRPHHRRSWPLLLDHQTGERCPDDQHPRERQHPHPAHQRAEAVHVLHEEAHEEHGPQQRAQAQK